MFRIFLRLSLALLALAPAWRAAEPPAQLAPTPKVTASSKTLVQILISNEGIEGAKALEPRPAAGFVALGSLISAEHLEPLTARLLGGKGRLIDEPLLAAIAQVVENYFKQHGYPLATAVVPPQSISEGAVRVALLPGSLLKQILVTSESIEAAQAFAPPSSDGVLFLAASIPAQHQKPLLSRLNALENRPIDEPLLVSIGQAIEAYFRQNDFPLATAYIPAQDMSTGIVRVALLPGKIRNIKFEGNRWFSEKLLREKLRISEGAALQFSLIDQSLAWTNANSFRNVKVQVQPVSDRGDADLLVAVRDVAPWRVFASVDNTGNEILGTNHFIGGFTAANVWGKDHQLTYQYITSEFNQLFGAHTFDYRIPFSWRHSLVVSGSWLEANPTLFEGYFLQKGRSGTADIKYFIPSAWRGWRVEYNLGLSGKQSNNNLEYGGTPVLGSVNDSFLASAGFAATRDDTTRQGRWTVGASVGVSPGSINSRNTPEHFSVSRHGANSRYLQAQMNIERLTRLTDSVASLLKLSGQVASTRLLPFEQYSVGGANSVRGYDERMLSGDLGYSVSHEFYQRLPSVKIHPRLATLDSHAILFWDFARTFIHQPSPGQRQSDYLASAGCGVRANLSTWWTASIDHAWQLEAVDIAGAKHQRTHFRISVSF